MEGSYRILIEMIFDSISRVSLLFLVFLLTFLPLGGAEIGPLEVVVGAGVLVAVVLEGLLVRSQASLAQLEGLTTIAHSAERCSVCSFECLI